MSPLKIVAILLIVGGDRRPERGRAEEGENDE